MSTIDDPQAKARPVPGSAEDPFRYGWRHVVVKQPDGRVELEQVPLTLEDLLFPEEGDFTAQFRSHIDDCLYLKMVFDALVADVPDAVVTCDNRVDFNIPGVRPLGPDVAVFFGVPRSHDPGTLAVADPGVRPILVVEVTSPDTRKNDLRIKKAFYERGNIPYYVIVDARPDGKRRRVKLLGFRNTPGGFEPIPLDDQDRLWLEPLGVWLTIIDERVACVDGETGRTMEGYVAQSQARADAEARAADESRIAAEATARADANTRIAEVATARADAAEARTRELEAELRRLRGEA